VTSTPSLAYLVPKKQMMGGVMISASHNPAAFNGIKLFSPIGRKCPDAWERLIERRVTQILNPTPHKTTLLRDGACLKDYLDFLRRSVPARTSFKGLKLVIDCSHGSLSKIAPTFLRKLGVRVIAIGSAPNGKNINAGWGSQHPEKMQRVIREEKADGGMAFDGDADRIILCDETGAILDGDYILACVARCLKEENRLAGNMVVVTVMANLGLLKALRAWGVDPLITPVGDRFVSDKLEECGGVIGGEQSGHIIFHHLLPTGDGLLTGLQVLSMLAQRNKPLSWIRSLITKYPQVLENVRVKHKRPLEECPAVQSEISRAVTELGDDGRVLVRYSGTEPLLRVMMEGPSALKLRELTGRIVGAPHPGSGMKLGVNIDHVATLRQQRREKVPDPVYAALVAQEHGADSIVAHLREDRRHIQDRDIRLLKEVLAVPLAMEMAATDEMVRIALEVRPARVCLVPEKRQELTTEGGLDVVAKRAALRRIIPKLIAKNIDVSLFIDADSDQIRCAKALGAGTIELHTGRYASAQGPSQAQELAKLLKASELAAKVKLQLHAGHGLDYRNVGPVARLPGMMELNIGFSIMTHAVFVGLGAAVEEMKELLCAE
jgi:phosphoglucosamine mutase